MSSNKWSRSSSQGASFAVSSSSPTSSGWGKKATKRIDTAEVFKKDPLLKSLEGKIAVGFGDYKPWQRTSLPRNAFPTKSVTSKSTRKSLNRPISVVTRSTYSAGGTSKGRQDYERPTSGVTIYSQCSSVCLHPWLKKPVSTPSFFTDKRKQKFLSVLWVCGLLLLLLGLLYDFECCFILMMDDNDWW